MQGEWMDVGYNCSVTVATDSQSVIDYSRRRGHSVASKHVGLRGLWLQEALENKILQRILLMYAPKRYLEIGFTSCVGWLGLYVCCSEEDMGDGPDEWYLSRLDELCRGEKFEQSFDSIRTELRF